ncbi:hypothetical protein V9T40_012905 [Parthenolecanium corni]|uniref:Timeless N-terminal domain-containing protein n=1 Tax=Parthenolecanium corni TaxID=536013 RepID=A0AAN9XZW2_9HEMI
MSRLIAELTASINALGYAAGKTHYFVDTECKEAIRELIRFLRRDDETHEIRRYLGAARILQSDLVPIVKNHHNDDEILDLILRLLVNLTTPALLLYNEEPPVDKVSNQQYFEIVGHLQEYKLAFAKQQIWTILSQKLSDLLKMDWADRGEEKSMIIVRILVLVRNVLHVPTDTDFENRPDNDADSHDQVLWALQEGGILDIILYIASSDDERQYFFHILEIVSLMLRDQNAEVLASASVQRSLAEKERDMEELIAARRKDKEEKQKRKSLIMSRHPRFSGTYVVKGVKSIGDNDLVVQSLDCKVALTFDRNKRKLKTPKNRQPMQTQTTERRSAFSVRVLMKEFCIEFLNGAYNGFMHYVRELLHRGKAQANDESYFFWALRFFMEFNRNYKCEVKLISETMHVSIFHFTQERIENWRARLDVEKKKFRLWSKRMHLGLKAYKELLMTLMKMYLHTDHTVKESAHTIMSNIFYVIEYRELLMVLMNIFDPIKFSTEYLKDLIEANHIFMKLLDHYCKRHRTLVVQKKGKSSKRKKKSKGPAAQHSASLLNLEPTEEKWEVLESKITDIFENNTELNVQSIPFDAASDVPFEEQKIEAMRKIRFFLLKSEVEEAVGLLRASREVWPENDCFGSENMSVSEECAALKEIFLADIGLPAASAGVVKRKE